MSEIQVKLVEETEEKSIQVREAELLAAAGEDVIVPEDDVKKDEPEIIDPVDIEIDESQVKSFFEKKYGKQVESFDDLFQEPKVIEQELDEDVAAFQKYKKETGRGLDDFIKLNKDYSNMDSDQVLLEWYANENPELTREELMEEIQDKFGYDDYADDSEISKKERAKKKELAKATKELNALKEQYKAPLESRGLDVPEEEKSAWEEFKQAKETSLKQNEDAQQKAQYFQQKTDELFSSNFEGFGFNTEDGNKVVYKPKEVDEIKVEQSSVLNFINKFLDADGKLKDAEAYHRSIAVALDPDKFFKFAYEKGKADNVKDLAANSKNIDMTRNTPQIVSNGGFSVKAVNADRGNRLIIKKS
jgi:hypothetical protein